MATKLQQFGNFVNSVVDQVGSETGLSDIAHGVRDGNVDVATRGMEVFSNLLGPQPYSPNDPVRDALITANSSYSGADVVPIAQINGTLVTLANVETISISVFREKEPVRTLGRSYAKCYTAGQRTIAGSITFVVFNRDPFWDIIKYLKEDTVVPTDKYSTPVGDQIPPFNLILWFSNEYGHKSIMTLIGVEFTQEGQVHSVNDIYSEKTVQYVARDYNILMDEDDVQGMRNLMYQRQLTGQFTDNYLASMLEYQKTIQGQLQDAQNTLYTLQQSKAKGFVTLGLGFIPAGGLSNINSQMTTQRKLIDQLQIELNKTQQAIDNWSRSAYSGGNGNPLNNDTALQNTDFRKVASQNVTLGNSSFAPAQGTAISNQ